MARPNKARASAPQKAPRKKRASNPLREVFDAMDENVFALLKQTFETDFSGGAALEADAIALFRRLLDGCRAASLDDDEKTDLLEDLGERLADLRIDASGGHRAAREAVAAIRAMLDAAIAARELQVVDLMIVAKLFAEAGLEVPETLKQAASEAMEAGRLGAASRGGGGDLVAALLEDPDILASDPFDVHDTLRSLTAGLTAAPIAALMGALVAGGNAVVDAAAAGFLLHPDAEVARAVSGAFVAAAARAPVAALLVDRLVRIRAWLPASRQGPVDEAIRAMRSNAAPPVATPAPEILKCSLSVCDGSGAHAALVTMRAGADYQCANILMTPEGVADALVIRELPRRELSRILGEMQGLTPSAATDLPAVARMLAVAIADNFASGRLPPYKLVDVAESVGLGPIHPDSATPESLLEGLLAGLSPQEVAPKAVATAHARVSTSELADQWFETGEAVEAVLEPVAGGHKARVAELLKVHLPERRAFWARQCALSALALRDDGASPRALWKQIALVGRDIAASPALETIPLMRRIAEYSVEAFERQM